MWYLRLVIMVAVAILGGGMFAALAVNLLRAVVEIEDGSPVALLIIAMFILPFIGIAIYAALQENS